ncbi:MAG: hypothetical protein ACK416_06750, partial [Zestosphaera sp.]
NSSGSQNFSGQQNISNSSNTQNQSNISGSSNTQNVSNNNLPTTSGSSGVSGSNYLTPTPTLCDFPCVTTPTIVYVPYNCEGRDYTVILTLLDEILRKYTFLHGMTRTEHICKLALTYTRMQPRLRKEISKLRRVTKVAAGVKMNSAARSLLNMSLYPIIKCEAGAPCQKVEHPGYNQFIRDYRDLIKILKKTYTACLKAAPLNYYASRNYTGKYAATFLLFHTLPFVAKSVEEIHKQIPSEIYVCR